MTVSIRVNVPDPDCRQSFAQVKKALDELTAPGGGASVSDAVYGAAWNGVTTIAPSKNAVYDKIEALSTGGIRGEFRITLFAVATPVAFF